MYIKTALKFDLFSMIFICYYGKGKSQTNCAEDLWKAKLQT